MSISRVEIRNFQSLRQVDLDLGTFTVIVGPSSSGKSAIMRSIRALASNVRGASVITRGQKTMAITARTDTHVITLERTERAGTYRVVEPGGNNLTFTKLGGDVPVQVAEALRIDPSRESVNFASQFDRPYLLDESGAAVARELGELTNVTLVFEAVGRANKTRAKAATALKARQSDLDLIKTRLGAYKDLSGQLKALEEAEKADGHRRALQDRVSRLSALIAAVRVAQADIDRKQLPPVPDASNLNTLAARARDLARTLTAARAADAALLPAKDNFLSRTIDESSAKNAIHSYLQEIGVCPTCRQEVR